MTQQNKEVNAMGGKIDQTFPDGVGEVGKPQAVSTTPGAQAYDYSQGKIGSHAKDIVNSAIETARYGGHGQLNRE